MTFGVVPVPIPNTEVKPKCAENTCGLPCWEDRLLLDFLFYLYKIFMFLLKYLKVKYITNILFLNVLTLNALL